MPFRVVYRIHSEIEFGILLSSGPKLSLKVGRAHYIYISVSQNLSFLRIIGEKPLKFEIIPAKSLKPRRRRFIEA
jgi:hypothetical protein